MDITNFKPSLISPEDPNENEQSVSRSMESASLTQLQSYPALPDDNVLQAPRSVRKGGKRKNHRGGKKNKNKKGKGKLQEQVATEVEEKDSSNDGKKGCDKNEAEILIEKMIEAKTDLVNGNEFEIQIQKDDSEFVNEASCADASREGAASVDNERRIGAYLENPYSSPSIDEIEVSTNDGKDAVDNQDQLDQDQDPSSSHNMKELICAPKTSSDDLERSQMIARSPNINIIIDLEDNAVNASLKDDAVAHEVFPSTEFVFPTQIGMRVHHTMFSTRLSAYADLPCQYEVRASPGKGQGTFATDRIPRGTRLLAESALFLLPERDSLSILPIFAALTPQQKATFLDLHRPLDQERDSELTMLMTYMEEETAPSQRIGLSIEDQVTAQVIVWANSHAAGDGSGIFPTISRINHSCIPNVYHSWNDNLQQLTVHAVRDISLSEELFTSYIPVCLTRDVRNDGDHLGRYGFVCSCPACEVGSVFARKSAIRRRKLAALDKQVTEYFFCPQRALQNRRKQSSMELNQVLSSVREMVRLMEEEGIANMDLARW